MFTTLGLAIIITSWFARQHRVPGFEAVQSPYAVTLTANHASYDYLDNLDIQQVSTEKPSGSEGHALTLDAKTVETVIGRKLPESVKHVKIDASPATLFQAMKGDAKIAMDRDTDSVRFRMVKPNPYLKVD